MRDTGKTLVCALIIGGSFGSSRLLQSAQLIDDRAITIHSANGIVEKRTQLCKYIWGNDGFPKGLQPSEVITNIATPVDHLSHLARVDELRLDMAPGLQGLAWHFIPEKPNHELVVVHHGHGCTMNDDASTSDVGHGLQRTINGLLKEGYGVLGVFMPRMRPGDCTGNHEQMFSATMTNGSALRYFLEPVAASLNYLKSHSANDHFPKYNKFHMAGLSGGGWTTTVYAAIDPTIECSFPIAGSIPLHLRSNGSIGDLEQFEPSFYSIAGYPDLYVLGSAGRGRKQVQVLVRRDDCCFGEAQHDPKTAGLPYAEAMRQYENQVQSTLKSVGDGSFRLEIDETAPSHMISHHAIDGIIIPELRKGKLPTE